MQILANIVLYGLLLWQVYESTIAEWDPWNAFVVCFVLLVAVVLTVLPGYHASHVSPGSYPYEDE